VTLYTMDLLKLVQIDTCASGADKYLNSMYYVLEADSGMFSMIERTAPPPTKRGPYERTGKFLQHSNMPEIIEIMIRKQFCVSDN